MNGPERVVGLAFGQVYGPRCCWWWPVEQVEQRVRTLSTTMLVRALRTGVLEAPVNPPSLIDRLADELRRRRDALEEMPASLTEEEIDRWTGLGAPSAARR